MIPAGSSYGAAIRRPMISHISTNEAPSKALVGRRYLASLPNKVLHICGTIRPMKLNRPAKLTTRPASMLDNTRRKNLVSGTFNHKERA